MVATIGNLFQLLSRSTISKDSIMSKVDVMATELLVIMLLSNSKSMQSHTSLQSHQEGSFTR